MPGLEPTTKKATFKKNKHLKEFGPKPNMSPPDWVQARVHYI